MRRAFLSDVTRSYELDAKRFGMENLADISERRVTYYGQTDAQLGK